MKEILKAKEKINMWLWKNMRGTVFIREDNIGIYDNESRISEQNSWDVWQDIVGKIHMRKWKWAEESWFAQGLGKSCWKAKTLKVETHTHKDTRKEKQNRKILVWQTCYGTYVA